MNHHGEASTIESRAAAQENIASFGARNAGLQVTQNHGNITANFNYQSEESEIQLNRECLQALCETNPQRDKDRIERHKGGLLEDAYIWVLENAEFKRWRFEEKDQLLWIKGDPGKGKTMLLCGILNELMKSTVASETTIIYFFCQATDAKLNNATGVLRGLIFMLIDQHPTLISHVRREYDKDKRIFEDRRNSWETLSQMLVKILEDPTLQKVYVIIDALDECTTDLNLLLEFIVQIQSSNMHGKWLVTSRNEISIEEILETHEIESKKKKLSLELNEDSVSKAVELFINFRVRILSKRKRYSPGTRDAVIQHLLSNAHGTFLWVALVCDELLSPRLSNLQVPKKLKQFPAGLDKLYQRMLDQIDNDPDSEICKYILGITTTVYRPITLEELSSYIDFSEDDDISYLAQLIGLCGSFLTLRGSIISLVHQSAKDFIHQKAVDKVFPCGPEQVHYDIFSKSLDAITKTLRRDIYDLIHPGYEIGKVEQPDPDPLAAVRYPCIYWVDHLRACSPQVRAEFPDDFAEGGTVDIFFCKSYLHWLEAISLLGSVSKGVAAILTLEDLVESETDNAELVDRVKDASRFLLYHQVAIRCWPLQVYASALIFSPVNSRTRIQYEDQQPLWITLQPDMEYQWSPCLQTLEEHSLSVNSVAFSHDSKFIASASDDCTVKIWDTSSGECLTTLENSDPVLSMALSRDSKLLVSMSRSLDAVYSSEYRSTIKLWNTDNSHCIMTIEDDEILTSVVLYEPDYIVCGSHIGTIKIWDTKSRKCFKVLEGHDSLMSAVTISQKLSLIALASAEKTIKIRDLRTGKCVQTLEEHRGSVYSVSFSPDSLLLASGSDDNIIKLWKTDNWNCIQTLGDDVTGMRRSQNVMSLVFSDDSRVLAACTEGHDVYLWNTSNRLLLQIFKGHGGSISSIAFSHDSKLLASASADTTIRIWDATSRERPRDFNSHNAAARPYFPHDFTLLATKATAKPHDVKIWDVHSGRCLQTLNDWPDDPDNSLIFSNDLKYLASFLGGQQVQVWDISSGESLPLYNELYYGYSRFPLEPFVPNCELSVDPLASSSHAQFQVSTYDFGPHYSEGLGLTQYGPCIMWNNECLLWLPPEYRPAGLILSEGMVIAGSILCISCASGRVLFFNFDSSAISQLIATSKAKELERRTSQSDAELGAEN